MSDAREISKVYETVIHLHVLSLQIIVNSVAEGRQKIVDASFCWEFSVGFHLGRPERKLLSHLILGVNVMSTTSASLQGAQRPAKTALRQSTIDRAEAALRAQAQCPGGAVQVLSFQDIPWIYPWIILD